MNPILHSVSLFAAHASGSLLAATWEGALLALAVFLCLRLLPGLSAAARSVIWLNTFILLVLLHFVPVFAGHSRPPAEGSVAALRLSWLWSLGVAALWLALSLWRSFQLLRGALHLRRLARRATPVVSADPELARLLRNTCEGRSAQLCACAEVARPSVLGFFHPRVLLPLGLTEALSPQELRQVVLHEMEHLRRADDWTNLLQKLGLLLFPLNPVLLWVEQRLCAERELACDDRVIHSAAGRKAYALCLTHLAELSLLRRSFSLVLGAFERRSELVRRIHRIVQEPSRTMSRKAAFAATGGLVAGALACALLLANSPQLVTFVPTTGAKAGYSADLNPQAVARALGGTPQLVKAAITVPANRPVTANRPVNREHARQNTPRRRPHQSAPSLIASVNTAPVPNLDSPLATQSTMVVLTEFRAVERAPRVVLAVAPDRPTRTGRTAVVTPARYAVVPLPNGWLIIQI